jgi:beta-glucanase (GH16 family)
VDAISNGYALNLTADGRCTGTNLTGCVAVSNATTGSIINPVQGARLVTKGKASIKYGKIEIIAKMPTGDWIWPAIWMMPEDDVYGEWPKSGEIDVGLSLAVVVRGCPVGTYKP